MPRVICRPVTLSRRGPCWTVQAMLCACECWGANACAVHSGPLRALSQKCWLSAIALGHGVALGPHSAFTFYLYFTAARAAWWHSPSHNLAVTCVRSHCCRTSCGCGRSRYPHSHRRWLGEWRSSPQARCPCCWPHAHTLGWVGVQEELGRSEAELRRTKAELEMMQLTSRRSVAATSLQDTTAATATDEEV